MKVRKLLWPFLLVGIGLSACEESAEPADGEAAAPAPAEGPSKAAEGAAEAPKEVPAPDAVCTSLMEAAKAKDEEKFATMSMPGAVDALGSAGAKDAIMAMLGTATCGAAKVEGDKAWVPVTAGEATRDIPFLKAADGQWKFDAAEYLAKYPVEAAEEDAKGKTKNGKKVKGAKAKSKGKGKGKKG